MVLDWPTEVDCAGTTGSVQERQALYVRAKVTPLFFEDFSASGGGSDPAGAVPVTGCGTSKQAIQRVARDCDRLRPRARTIDRDDHVKVMDRCLDDERAEQIGDSEDVPLRLHQIS
jgi:hypothetical protein